MKIYVFIKDGHNICIWIVVFENVRSYKKLMRGLFNFLKIFADRQNFLVFYYIFSEFKLFNYVHRHTLDRLKSHFLNIGYRRNESHSKLITSHIVLLSAIPTHTHPKNWFPPKLAELLKDWDTWKPFPELVPKLKPWLPPPNPENPPFKLAGNPPPADGSTLKEFAIPNLGETPTAPTFLAFFSMSSLVRVVGSFSKWSMIGSTGGVMISLKSVRLLSSRKTMASLSWGTGAAIPTPTKHTRIARCVVVIFQPTGLGKLTLSTGQIL